MPLNLYGKSKNEFDSWVLAEVGEVGLAGEVRGVSQANLRIREAEQMGFTRIVLPASNVDLASEEPGKAELVGVRSVGEALDMLLA